MSVPDRDRVVSLPDWLEPLPGAAEQRALDEWAIGERGIPGLELMERAGEGLTNLVCELAPNGTIAVVCGKGNNGGDGLVAARLLRQAGRDVEVLGRDGPPVVQLHGAVAERARALGVRVDVSLTHSHRDAAAVAIAQ